MRSSEKSFKPTFQSGSKYWFYTLFYTQTSDVEPVCRISFFLWTGFKNHTKTGIATQDK